MNVFDLLTDRIYVFLTLDGSRHVALMDGSLPSFRQNENRIRRQMERESGERVEIKRSHFMGGFSGNVQLEEPLKTLYVVELDTDELETIFHVEAYSKDQIRDSFDMIKEQYEKYTDYEIEVHDIKSITHAFDYGNNFNLVPQRSLFTPILASNLAAPAA